MPDPANTFTPPPDSGNLLVLLPLVAARGGDAIPFTYGGRSRLLLTDPAEVHKLLAQGADETRATPVTDAVRRIMGGGLLTSSMPEWQPRRLVVQRELSHRRVRAHAQLVSDNTAAMCARWQDGADVDLQAELATLTLDNLGDAVFGSDVRPFRDSVRTAVDATLRVLDEANAGTPTAEGAAQLEDAVRRLDELVATMSHAATAAGSDPDPAGADARHGGILAVLLAAAGAGEEVFADPWVRDEAVTLVLAGFDTTAFLSTMALWLLSTHDGARDLVRAEWDAAQAAGIEVTDLIDALPYTRQAVEEALRMYPPVPILHRTLPAGAVVAGVTLAEETIVVASAWVLHRDARLFPHPAAFDPGRFGPERRKEIPRNAFVPFGAGRRVCAGNHFALLQAVLVVAQVAATTDIVLADTTPPVVEVPVTMRCRDGVPARVSPRPSATSLPGGNS